MGANSMGFDEFIRKIHESGWQLVLVTAGGGSQAIADLLKVPGASRSILEAVIPYSLPALQQWLGSLPEQACAEGTARAMAMAAFLRARSLVSLLGTGAPDRLDRVAGVACTASLATDRPKKGDHRIHVAVQRVDVTRAFSLVLIKGARSRADEEEVARQLLLSAVATVCDLEYEAQIPLLPGEHVQSRFAEAPDSWRALVLGTSDAVCLGVPHDWEKGRPPVLFPGAFNPLHQGHVRMAKIAEAKLGRPVEFEISILNVDKPPLDYVEIKNRVEQFAIQERVWLTRLPTFVEKARRFPGCTFVVGMDTLLRIADPRYYSQSPVMRERALAEIADHGCRFLVFGRLIKGQFLTLENAEIPPALRAICQGVSEKEFREDICSTELRHSAQQAPEVP